MIDPDVAVPLLVLAVGVNMVIALGGFALGQRRAAVARSALIAQVLISTFFLLIVLTPVVQADAGEPDSPRLLSLAVFLGLLGLLKLLGRFEEH